MKKKVLKLNRETVKHLGTEELEKVVAGTCWNTIALPCNDEPTPSVSGTYC